MKHFNLKLLCILLCFVMIWVIIIYAPVGYADVDPNQVAIGEYKCELWEMWTYEPGHSNKMTYMDYRAITDKSSKQYALQQDPYCVVNEQGFLMYRDNWYVVAMGSYWGNIGDKFIVRLQNGKLFSIIIGDRKANTGRNGYAQTDGSVIEFLIQSDSAAMSALNVQYHGLISTIYPEFNSKIISITKVVETFG